MYRVGVGVELGLEEVYYIDIMSLGVTILFYIPTRVGTTEGSRPNSIPGSEVNMGQYGAMCDSTIIWILYTVTWCYYIIILYTNSDGDNRG